MEYVAMFIINICFWLIYAIAWLFAHTPQIVLALFVIGGIVNFIAMCLPKKKEKSGPYNPTPHYYFHDDNLKNITNQNESTHKEFTENLYCNMCGSEIEESEYYSNSGLCEECSVDIDVHYNEFGLDDYTKPYMDAVNNKKL